MCINPIPRWYLEHVYPESQMPLDYFFLGEMRNDASHNCLDTMGRKSGEEVGSSSSSRKSWEEVGG